MILIGLCDRHIDWEAAKTRVLSVLQQRTLRNESGHTSSEVRAITRLGEARSSPWAVDAALHGFMRMRSHDEGYGSKMAKSILGHFPLKMAQKII